MSGRIRGLVFVVTAVLGLTGLSVFIGLHHSREAVSPGPPGSPQRIARVRGRGVAAAPQMVGTQDAKGANRVVVARAAAEGNESCGVCLRGILPHEATEKLEAALRGVPARQEELREILRAEVRVREFVLEHLDLLIACASRGDLDSIRVVAALGTAAVPVLKRNLSGGRGTIGALRILDLADASEVMEVAESLVHLLVSQEVRTGSISSRAIEERCLDLLNRIESGGVSSGDLQLLEEEAFRRRSLPEPYPILTSLRGESIVAVLAQFGDRGAVELAVAAGGRVVRSFWGSMESGALYSVWLRSVDGKDRALIEEVQSRMGVRRSMGLGSPVALDVCIDAFALMHGGASAPVVGLSGVSSRHGLDAMALQLVAASFAEKERSAAGLRGGAFRGCCCRAFMPCECIS